MRCTCESIQPKQSASRTAASQVRPRGSTCFLLRPIHSSVALAWLASSQAEVPFVVEERRGRSSRSTRVACVDPAIGPLAPSLPARLSDRALNAYVIGWIAIVALTAGITHRDRLAQPSA